MKFQFIWGKKFKFVPLMKLKSENFITHQIAINDPPMGSWSNK